MTHGHPLQVQPLGPWPTAVALHPGTALAFASSGPCRRGKGLDVESEPLLMGRVALRGSLCPSELLPSRLQIGTPLVLP